MTLRHVALFLCLLVGLGASHSWAEERIRSFHSDIFIDEDGSMEVTESIRVRAENQRIKRGIFRDFPTRYKDRYGNAYNVEFRVLDVLRDGVEEPWHVKGVRNGTRVYIGSANTYLNPGEYSYTLRYRTDRQLGFFETHDELYWNVTGNGWDFPIDSASAEVVLPSNVEAAEIRMIGYTGSQGSDEQLVTSSVGNGSAKIHTTSSLLARQGMTFVMSIPKGIVAAPTPTQRLWWLLGDNLGLLLALVALFGSGGYLLHMWRRYGKDPEQGAIFPHYEPPPGYSPASLRYIRRMMYDDATFTAAVLSLAVKGHLSITLENRRDYVLHRQNSDATLAPGERELVNTLFRSSKTVPLSNTYHQLVSATRRAHLHALAKDYRNVYFKTNGKLLLPSIIASGLLLAASIVLGKAVPLAIGIFGIVLILHLVFAWLMRAPSLRGRRLLDKSEGFKLYLEVAEKDDLNLRNPPELTPTLFEAYLPYAIALGVEQDWAEQFADVFARLEAKGGEHYQPSWYSGRFHHSSLGTFSTAVGGGLSSAISSAGRPPGSSSGSSGGGFSGGGGGGGGGGGW